MRSGMGKKVTLPRPSTLHDEWRSRDDEEKLEKRVRRYAEGEE